MKNFGETPDAFGAGLVDPTAPSTGLHDPVGVEIAEQLDAERPMYGPQPWSPQAAWEAELCLDIKNVQA